MQELLILGSAILIGFFVQTTLGFAAALASFPIILTVYSLPEATGFLSIFLLIFSAILIVKNWEQIDKKLVSKLALTSIIGLIIGIKTLQYGSVEYLQKLFAIFILCSVIFSELQKREKLKIKLEKFSLLVGLGGGFVSGLFSSGGAVFVAYMTNVFKDAHKIRANVIAILGITNFIRVPALIESGILTYEIFTTAIKLMPVFFLALWLGHLFYKRINKEVLYYLIMTGLTLSGLKLLIS